MPPASILEYPDQYSSDKLNIVTITLWCTSALLVLLCSMLNSYFYEHGMQTSINLIIFFQKHFQSTVYNYTSNIVISSVHWLYLLYPFLCLYIYSDKIQGLKTIFILMNGSYLVHVVRLMYIETKPNFLSTEILPQSCRCELGMPSYLSMISMLLFLTIAWDHYSRDNSKSTWKRVLLLFVGFLGSMLISFDEFYKGNHTYFQVLTGSCIGLSVFFMGIIPANENRFRFVIYSNIIKNYAFNSAVNFRILTLYIVQFMLQAMLYFYKSSAWYFYIYKDFAVQANCTQKCSGLDLVTLEYMSSLNWYYLPLIFIFLIALVNDYHYNPNFYSQNQSKKGFYRIFWFMLSMIPFVYSKNYLDNSKRDMNISLCLLTTYVGIFMMFTILPFIYSKLGLAMSGDLEIFNSGNFFCSNKFFS